MELSIVCEIFWSFCLMFSMSFRWPKLTFPSFRVLEAKCLQKFRIDEQICLLRFVFTNCNNVCSYSYIFVKLIQS